MELIKENQEILFQRQQEMEDHAQAMGGLRFRRKLEKAIQSGTEAQVGAAKRLLSEGLEAVEAAMRAIAEANGRGAHRSTARKWIRLVGPDVAAYLSLRVVLNHIHGRISVRKAAMEVTELIIDELRFRRFKQEEPRLFRYVMTGFTTSSYSHRARSLDARIHHANIDVSDLVMTPSERLTVGVKLIDTVREVTGLVEVVSSKVARAGGRFGEVVELVATEETLRWLEEGNKILENLWPVHLPMVMPPLPWGPGKRGGYRFALRGKHSLVRAACKAQREAIENAHMPLVYDAVNRIQETAWRVNKRVLEVVEHLFFEAGGGVAGLPPASDLPLPEKPHDIDHNEEARRAWRKAAAQVRDDNHDAKMRRKTLYDLLNVTRKVKDAGAIWFPHNVDFRGRVYPITSFLHPQGDDLTKGLLEFADAKPVGLEGAKYLKLHGAACMDETPDGRKLGHMTIEDRLAYIDSIEDEIRKVAEDPLSNTFWMDAGDRWQFLAFCFDYAGYLREGPEYASRLPVAMDGSCNGLQHFAALWRDPVGGKLVNVVPTERPHDIYHAVAEEVLRRLEEDAGSNRLAALWLRSGLVNRDLCKRPVMTFGYGSERFGFSEQLAEKVTDIIREAVGADREKLRDLFSEEVHNEETGKTETRRLLYPAASYLAGLIWDALGAVSHSAFEGMAWFRECAKIIAKDAGRHVSWVVPGTGFPVVQGYSKEIVKKTETILAGSAFRPRVWHDTDEPDWRKQAQGAPPNVVHSLDAAALMLTVNLAAAEGVDSFWMVHDSYGTHAGDAPILARCTRQAFYTLYTQHDVVKDLEAQWSRLVDGCKDKTGAPIVIPEPPEKGVNGELMDLGGVLLSEYFFS